jgi:putative transcriptional regulator
MFTDSILISNPAINDIPKFKEIAGSLIYIIHHDDQGAVGVSLNKNFSKTVSEIGNDLAEFALINEEQLLSPKTIFGGPVAPNTPWILGRNMEQYPQQFKNSSISLNFSKEAFEAHHPGHFAACGLGTFGWGAGQLEKEMASFLWHSFPANTAIESIPFDSQYRGAIQLFLAMRF